MHCQAVSHQLKEDMVPLSWDILMPWVTWATRATGVTGVTGATAVEPKFSDTLTLFQPGEQILPQHRRSCTNISPTVTSLIGMCNLLVDLFVS